MTVEQVRAAFRRWHTAVQQGTDPMSAMLATAAPDCIVHSPNGEVGDVAIVGLQMAQARRTFPDLEATVEHLMVTDDRLVAQMSLESSPALPFGLAAAAGKKIRAISAFVARINDDAEFVEIWPYSNPGAAFTFPPRAKPASPPEVTGAPGNETLAQALCETWARAITMGELVERIVATSAANCLVHATNADEGRVDLVEEQFNIVGGAFPDATVEFENTAFEGERFITQFQLSGTHRGQLGIMPATGRRVESTGAIAGRVDAAGRAMELWVYLSPGIALMFPRGDRPRE